MISNFKRNILGTVDFDGKFKGMRKAQGFCVYPMHAGGATGRVKIQSDTRIGYIFSTGEVVLSPARAGGAFNHHLTLATHVDTLTGEELLLLKSAIQSTASGMAGRSGICFTDNSEAISFGATA